MCRVMKNCFFFFSLFFSKRERERERERERKEIPFYQYETAFFASSLLLLPLFKTFINRREHSRTDASDDDYESRCLTYDSAQSVARTGDYKSIGFALF